MIVSLTIAYQAVVIFEVSEQAVTSFEKSMYNCGILTIAYFICACLKDIGILAYFILFGGPLSGFDRAVFVHLMTIPVDSVAILALSIWGSALLTQ